MLLVGHLEVTSAIVPLQTLPPTLPAHHENRGNNVVMMIIIIRISILPALLVRKLATKPVSAYGLAPYSLSLKDGILETGYIVFCFSRTTRYSGWVIVECHKLQALLTCYQSSWSYVSHLLPCSLFCLDARGFGVETWLENRPGLLNSSATRYLQRVRISEWQEETLPKLLHSALTVSPP